MWPSKINPIFDENDEVSIFFRMYFCILTFFFLFRDIPVAYGSSQARGRIRAAAAGPTPQTQQLGIWAASMAYTIACGNARSLTHWAGPGIEPTSSWILVEFLTCWATMGTPVFWYFKHSVRLIFMHTFHLPLKSNFMCRYEFGVRNICSPADLEQAVRPNSQGCKKWDWHEKFRTIIQVNNNNE